MADYTWNGSAEAQARQYVNGGQYIDERVVMRDIAGAGQDHYYLLEELYSVAGLAGAVGQLEEMYVYDTYGRATVWAWRPGDVNRDSLVNAADTDQYDTWRTAGSPLADLHADGTLAYGQDPNLDLAVIEDHLSMIPEPVTYSSLDNPFMFTGRLTDTINDADEPVITQETRFRRIQDNRNRMYDPHHGRWFQRDPLGVRPDAPGGSLRPLVQYADGMNLYQYVKSNPLALVDWTGEQASQPGVSPPTTQPPTTQPPSTQPPMPPSGLPSTPSCTLKLTKTYYGPFCHVGLQVVTPKGSWEINGGSQNNPNKCRFCCKDLLDVRAHATTTGTTDLDRPADGSACHCVLLAQKLWKADKCYSAECCPNSNTALHVILAACRLNVQKPLCARCWSVAYPRLPWWHP